jgi:SAM-dependent methyltransferase
MSNKGYLIINTICNNTNSNTNTSSNTNNSSNINSNTFFNNSLNTNLKTNLGVKSDDEYISSEKTLSDKDFKLQEINIMKSILEFKKKGIKDIEIFGCDPLEYTNITSLIKYLKYLGFEKISLNTRGYFLKKKSLLNDLKNAGLDKIYILLYDTNIDINKSNPSFSVNFLPCLDYISNIFDAQIDMDIVILISKQNKDEIIKLIDILRKKRVNKLIISIPKIPNVVFSDYCPLKDLTINIKDIYNYCRTIGFNINFIDIPFCVFGKYDALFINKSSDLCLIDNVENSSNDIFNSNLNLISSLKKKEKMCDSCFCYELCDGFNSIDITYYGVDGLKPLDLFDDKDELENIIKQNGFNNSSFEEWEKYRKFISNAINSNCEVLDIGCGNGFLLKCLERWSNHKIIPFGIDINIMALNKAKNIFNKFKSNFFLLDIKDSVNHFIKRKMSFNVILWNVWSNYYFDKKDEIDELHGLLKLLKPNGYVVLIFYEDLNQTENLKKISALKKIGFNITTIFHNKYSDGVYCIIKND